MDVDGVWGQLCFPNFACFAGHLDLDVADTELGLACLRTYNDYLLDEWVRDGTVAVVRRGHPPAARHRGSRRRARSVLAKGAKAIAFSENPTVLGLPSVHTDHWDASAIADEAEVPVCMHIGSSSRLVTTSEDVPATVLVSLNGLNSMMAGVDWLMSGVLDRFSVPQDHPVRGGAGWIPYIVERAEKAFHDPRLQANAAIGQSGRGGTPPSQLFAQHVYVCLVDEHFVLEGPRRHPRRQPVVGGRLPPRRRPWPHNHSYLEKALADVPDADVSQIVETNLRGRYDVLEEG